MFVDGKLLSDEKTKRIEVSKSICLDEISEGDVLVFPDRDERVIKKANGLTINEGISLVTLLQETNPYTLPIRIYFCRNSQSNITPNSYFYERKLKIRQ